MEVLTLVVWSFLKRELSSSERLSVKSRGKLKSNSTWSSTKARKNAATFIFEASQEILLKKLCKRCLVRLAKSRASSFIPQKMKIHRSHTNTSTDSFASRNQMLHLLPNSNGKTRPTMENLYKLISMKSKNTEISRKRRLLIEKTSWSGSTSNKSQSRLNK